MKWAARTGFAERCAKYLLAVPSNTLIRDLEVEPPLRTGKSGPPPARPWRRVDKWLAAQPDSAWTTLDVRDGAKGPLIVECITCRVAARTNKHGEAPAEVLVVLRYKDRDNVRVVKTDYHLSNAAAETPRLEFARVAKAEHRIEECLQRAKSEAGLADYEVRTWVGWQHHQTLSLLAVWFLVCETRRGKKIHTGDHAPTNSGRHIAHPAPRVRMRFHITYHPRTGDAPKAQPTRQPVSLETA